MPQEYKTNKLKSYFLTGILVSAPLAITIYLAVKLVNFIDNKITGFLPEKYNPETYFPYGIPGLGLIVLLIALVLIGWMSSGFVGNLFLKLMNKMIGKLPIVSGIYSAIRKVMETVMGSEKAKAFREAVLVQYPREGLWTIAFITGEVYSGIQKEVKSRELVSIYVPTTPNPTSGFLIFVPKKDIIHLKIRVDDAWKIIISTGIITPDSPQKQQAIMDKAIATAKDELKNVTSKVEDTTS